MTEPDDKLARDMETLAHASVPRAFLKKWLLEQERCAAGRPLHDWKHTIPRPRGKHPVKP